MRRILIFAAVILVLAAVGVGVLLTLGPGRAGLQDAGTSLKNWLGSQVVGIANSYLVPDLAYEEIDFERPGTLVLGGVSLTAPDGTEVLAVDRMTVTLTEVPRIGEPIRIAALRLSAPTVNLIREVGPDGSAGFRGLSPIVERAPLETEEPADTEIEENFRLSNVLRLETIEIEDGRFRLDVGDGSPPMVIAGLTTAVHAVRDADEPGLYNLDIETSLGPLLDMSLRGALNLDSFLARLDSFRLHGELTEESAGALPPQLQTLRSQYGASGIVDLRASGAVPLTDPLAGDLEFGVDLGAFRIASGEYQLPIDAANISGSLRQGRVEVPSYTVSLLGGSVGGSFGSSIADSAMPAELDWTIDGLSLEGLLANASGEGGAPPKLAGTLTGSGRVTTSLADPIAGIDGGGELRARDGRLLVLPALTQLAGLMKVSVGNSGELSHRFDAAFELEPAALRVTSSEVVTEFLAARGTGTIGYDGALDLTVNAGPMERLQSLLGGVGDALGKLTDGLVKYRVRGRVGQPEVSVAPLGLGG